MRLFALILFSAVLLTAWADPEPKKYKSEVKDKASNTSLTDDERNFLREVEAKFGIKADVPVESTKNESEPKANGTSTFKAPFPAVIAIEIVNDTETTSKGKKRTIDANLGYGYRTNNGYTYNYYGKQPQEKGKFMIYPYSQEDIPPSNPSSYHSSHSSSSGGHYTTSSPNVEIQPSRAYELIDVKEEQNSYQYSNPTSSPNYQNIKGLVSPPPSYSNSHEETSSPQTHPSTLYTTYNGHDFSALSGKFPTVMSNYLVDPSQLVKNPQYQSAGLNQDYIRSHHGSQLDQRVVPVLVLRIPSSYLKKPTAELYSSSPHNQPVSNYLNQVNLQEIVNSYFKKIGYSYAPPVMAYQDSSLSEPAQTSAGHMANYEPQHYANPHVQHPSYTQADYSGVQYSGVQPVMAKYPSTYPQQQYYMPQSQSVYQQPEQQYEYTYQYMPQSEQAQAYYVQSDYQTQTEEGATQDPHSEYSAAAHSPASQANYGSQVIHETAAPVAEYGAPETQGRHAASAISHYETPQASSEYGTPREQAVEYVQQKPSSDHGPTKVYIPTYSSQPTKTQYGVPKNEPKETLAYYTSQSNPSIPKYSSPSLGGQNYYYQKQTGDDSLILTENYPSKDHTIATVLPMNYKRDKKPNTATVQTVSYVTPMPNAKYQSHYNIMVPQTVLRNPATEKVSYVNSHSLPYTQLSASQEYNPEAEYTVPSHYVPPVGKQKPSYYPRNYHSHPKRNAKPENKSESNTSMFKKQKERHDSKKSS